LSDGRAIEAPKFYRKSEAALATAQRANKTPKRIRRIHAKIAKRRKDFLHKESTPTLPRTFSVAGWLRLQKELAHEPRGIRSPAVRGGEQSHPLLGALGRQSWQRRQPARLPCGRI
jgi:hypothetical protein